jgi:hypothetical protein
MVEAMPEKKDEDRESQVPQNKEAIPANDPSATPSTLEEQKAMLEKLDNSAVVCSFDMGFRSVDSFKDFQTAEQYYSNLLQSFTEDLMQNPQFRKEFYSIQFERGLCRIWLGRNSATALEDFTEASPNLPDSDTRIALGKILTSRNSDERNAELDRLIERFPDCPELYGMRYGLSEKYMREGKRIRKKMKDKEPSYPSIIRSIYNAQKSLQMRVRFVPGAGI